jgi:uncharacterized membrane protein
MHDTSKAQDGATKAEIVIVLVAVSAIIGFSYFTAHHAAANTPPDPVFRHLVRPESTKPLFKTEYLYVPLLFQCVAWLSVAASLLPASIQESWLLRTHCLRRLYLYFTVAFCSLIWPLRSVHLSGSEYTGTLQTP